MTYKRTVDELHSFLKKPDYSELGRLSISEMRFDKITDNYENSLLIDLQFAISLNLDFLEEKSLLTEIIDDHIAKLKEVEAASVNEMNRIKMKEETITDADNHLMLIMMNGVLAARASIAKIKHVKWTIKSTNEENSERLMARAITLLSNE